MLVLTNIGKGGGGKTSTGINLAVVAAGLGRSVGLIDADPQRSLSQWHDVRTTADIKLLGCGAGRLDDMLRAARKAQLDLVIIDTAPALGDQTLAAMRVADMTLIPARPSIFDLRVTLRYAETMRSVGGRLAVVINSAPPRREGLDSPIVRDVRAVLANKRIAFWNGQITQRHVIMTALIQGQGVAENDPTGPAAFEYRQLWTAVGNTLGVPQIRRIA